MDTKSNLVVGIANAAAALNGLLGVAHRTGVKIAVDVATFEDGETAVNVHEDTPPQPIDPAFRRAVETVVRDAIKRKTITL